MCAIKMFEMSKSKIFSSSLKVVQGLRNCVLEQFIGTALGLVTMHIIYLNNCCSCDAFIWECDPIWKIFQSAIPLLETAMVLYCAVKFFSGVWHSIRHPQEGLFLASVTTLGAVAAVISFGK